MSLEDMIRRFKKGAKRGFEVAVIAAGIACLGETCYVKLPRFHGPPITITKANEGEALEGKVNSNCPDYVYNGTAFPTRYDSIAGISEPGLGVVVKVSDGGTIYSCTDETCNTLNPPIPPQKSGNYTIEVRCVYGSTTASTITSQFTVRDVTAPDVIDDLFATPSTQYGEKVVLAWTSPGDDGPVGSPNRFFIAYSADPINTEDDWNNATVLWADSVAATGPVGTPYVQDFDIPAGTWHYNVRAVDDGNNGSPVSNSPTTTVKSKAEFFVDATLPSTVFYLHNEAWPLMNGDIVNGINGKALELGTILATVTAAPFDTPEAMRYYLLDVTDNVYNTPQYEYRDFELCHINSSLIFNHQDNHVRLDTKTSTYENCFPGYPDQYNNLTEEQMQNFRNGVREFLIEYVNAHPQDYGNLNPIYNPGWNTYPSP